VDENEAPPRPDEEAPRPRCPFCDSSDGDVISLFGTQVMTMQVRCRSCGSYYEAAKY
jgi:transcription elongation factor Elf1